MRLGFIGLGNVGRPMAERLLETGYELIVHNRSQAVVERLVRAGARRGASAREVSQNAELILTALPYPVTDEAIYLGLDGLCEHAQPGQILISHATVNPDLSRRIAAAARERGSCFLDAPVSGGPEAAEQGRLAIMVGGDAAAFERARPVLETLGTHVRLCGPSGSGAIVKLVNQVLITVHSAVTAEALTLAERVGADPAMAHEMLMAGLARSGILDRNGRRMLERDFEAGARIDLMVKDAALVRELCESVSLELPVFFRARASFEQALEQGYGGDDLAGIVRLHERMLAAAVQH